MTGDVAPISTPTPGSAGGSANLALWLTGQAAKRPDAPAIKQGKVTLSFAALNDASARAADLLAEHGVGPGDHVSLIMPNVAYFPIAYYAILRLGAVVVPTNPLLKAGEISYIWQDSDCRVAVVFAMFVPEAERAAKDTGTRVITVTPGDFDAVLAGRQPRTEVVPRTDQDTAVILYTSGTTGRPKARNCPTTTSAATSAPAWTSCSPAGPTTCCSVACRCSTPSARPAP